MIRLPFLGGGSDDEDDKQQKREDDPAAATRSAVSSQQEQHDGVHLLPSNANDGDDRDESLAHVSPPRAVIPLSMRLLRYTSGGCCAHCSQCCQPIIDGKEIDKNVILGSFSSSLRPPPLGVSPLVVAPMSLSSDSQLRQRQQPVLERILLDYKAACQLYECPNGPNPGVLTALRYQLPSLRVTPPFRDTDMLALAELLIKYGGGPLQFIRRLDFSKHRKIRGQDGMGSHGALALAKALQSGGAPNVIEILLQRNMIGPFGATAIFLACAQEDSSVEHLSLRRCRIGERGALALAAYIVPSTTTALTTIDISANHCGYHGCVAIDRAMQKRDRQGLQPVMTIDLEGNQVLQEIMNGVTHGMGVLMAFVGAYVLSSAVRGKSQVHSLSCGIYSISLVVLYTSSTLYHSFFTMRHTKYIFEVLDKCAIYILIAGSYTPFTTIVLYHEPLYSIGLLAFLWFCCILGIGVEFRLPTWQHKGKFSLAMFLAMGWSALVCLPEVARIIPRRALDWMVLGGVAYTVGVPFFVRSNNLDHAIWHLFVLAGSIFHWCGIYFYVAPRELSHVPPYSMIE